MLTDLQLRGRCGLHVTRRRVQRTRALVIRQVLLWALRGPLAGVEGGLARREVASYLAILRGWVRWLQRLHRRYVSLTRSLLGIYAAVQVSLFRLLGHAHLSSSAPRPSSLVGGSYPPYVGSTPVCHVRPRRRPRRYILARWGWALAALVVGQVAYHPSIWGRRWRLLMPALLYHLRRRPRWLRRWRQR